MILGAVFLEAPKIIYYPEKINTFEQIIGTAMEPGSKGLITYEDVPYPKFEFLSYLVTSKDILLHGSNRVNLRSIIPHNQTDYGGKKLTAVFACSDGIWPIFFAVLNYAIYRGSIRNACIHVGIREPLDRYYFFSINDQMGSINPWTDGMVYLLPKTNFRQVSQNVVRFDEWISENKIFPIARIPVSPSDFPFLSNVTIHSESETIFTSWLRYKSRQR